MVGRRSAWFTLTTTAVVVFIMAVFFQAASGTTGPVSHALTFYGTIQLTLLLWGLVVPLISGFDPSDKERLGPPLAMGQYTAVAGYGFYWFIQHLPGRWIGLAVGLLLLGAFVLHSGIRTLRR